MVLPMPNPLLPSTPLNREEKWPLHLEIAEHIVYLLFLVVMLSFALRLRKCKHNNSNSAGQTPASVSVAGNDDVGVPNINTQITIDPTYPTCLAVSPAMAGQLLLPAYPPVEEQ